MKVQSDHWLEGAKRRLIPGGSRMPIRRALVIHFTSGASAESSIEFWRSKAARGASAHLVIDRDGSIFQCRSFDTTCGHAGRSTWTDPNTGKRYSGLNACSIGIELANAGNDPKLAARYTKLPLVKARHKNGGPIEEWEDYPLEQLQACEIVARVLCERYNLDEIVGHDDIAPDRKNDPGPAFPMAELRQACGF